jgi:hypothetical protein
VASSTGFPSASNTIVAPSVFHVADRALPSELIEVTNVSGTTWSVIRGAESTTPVAHSSGFTIDLVISAGDMQAMLQGNLGLIYIMDLGRVMP